MATLALLLLAGPWYPSAPVTAQQAGEPSGDPSGQAAAIRLLLVSDTGEPIRNARLELRRMDGRGPPLSGEVRTPRDLGEGRYAFGPLPRGLYRVRAAAPGYAEASLTVHIAARETRELTLELSRRPLTLPEVVAAAAREEGAVRVGHSIDAVSFPDRPLGGATLAEWLESLAGVQIRRAAAGRQLLSVRGSRPEGVLVLLDGVPLNDPVTGVADLAAVPSSTLESATLVRGAAPGFGSGALAAVLLLRSAAPSDGSASAAVEAGSFGLRAVDGQLSVAGNAGQLSASFRLEEATNDFPFENRLLPDHPRETRRNADARGAHAAVTARSAALPLLLRLRVDDLERGAPGRMGTALFDRARWTEEGTQLGVELGRPGEPSVVASWRRRALAYRDPRAGREEEQRVQELHVRGELPFAGGWRVGGHLGRDWAAGDGVAAGAERLYGGTSVSARMGHGRIEAEPGLALEAADGRISWSPSLALVLRPGASWTVWSRAGQALRHPTLGDAHFASGPRLQPNAALRPERIALDAEVGAAWSERDGNAGARVAAYHRRTEDPIVWLASAVAVWSPRNLDRLTAAGVEADAYWRPSPGWRVEVAGSGQRSRVGFGTNRNPLPYAPALEARAAVERSWGGRALRLGVRAVGERTTSLAGTHRLPGVVVVDLGGRQELSAAGVSMTLDARLRNAFDAAYELVSLVPEPGRSLELRVQLGPFVKNPKRPAAVTDDTLERE